MGLLGDILLALLGVGKSEKGRAAGQDEDWLEESCNTIEATDNRNKSKTGGLMKDIDSLAHTKWRCQYHIVFAPKYRRQIIYGKYKAAIGKILRRICERCEGVEIIEANACEDHIHMLVTIPPKLSVSRFMG